MKASPAIAWRSARSSDFCATSYRGGAQSLELIGAQTGPYRFRRFFYSATKFAAAWCRSTLDLQVVAMTYVNSALAAGAEKGTFFHEPEQTI